MADTCETCRFWFAPDNAKATECRRYPPIPVVKALSSGDRDHDWYEADFESQWPRTNPDEFCGEFQPRPTDG